MDSFIQTKQHSLIKRMPLEGFLFSWQEYKEVAQAPFCTSASSIFQPALMVRKNSDWLLSIVLHKWLEPITSQDVFELVSHV